MKYKILLINLVILLVIISSSYAIDLTINGQTTTYDGPDINLILNGTKYTPKESEMPPVIIDGRTLVPVREVFEQLGGTVTWDDITRTVGIKKDDSEVRLTIDSPSALVNGKEKLLDVPAKIINNKTMVPVRFISENCGLNVDWDGDTNTVSIKLPNLDDIKDIIDTAYEKANELIENNADKIQDVVDKTTEIIENNSDKIQEIVDTTTDIIEKNISPAIKNFNEKFSRYFGDKKSKTVAYQLTDLVTSNNAINSDNAMTVTLIDENGQEISANTIAAIHDITSNILKYDKAFYEISGESNDEGYLTKIVLKRLPW